MNDTVRLHLGCGQVYKPGYVNIDLHDASVADMRDDIMMLPFDSESVDEIVAFHAVEHFDHINCKYLLSELSRVLKSGGEVVIETPDLEKTYSKLLRLHGEATVPALQWIFGIDSPGMQHKTGFTFDILKALLEEAGFEDVRRGDASTHTYEHGLRVTCRRASTTPRTRFASRFRRNLRSLGFDSYLLIPLERTIERLLKSLPEADRLSRQIVVEALAMTATVSPRLALILLDTLRETGWADGQQLDQLEPILRTFEAEDLHRRAFGLWTRSRKSMPVEIQFTSFVERIESDLREAMKSGTESRDQIAYLLGTEARDIPILAFELLMMESRKELNLGVRSFADGMHKESEAHLELAARMNPGNSLAHWNLARLALATNDEKASTRGHFENAIRTATSDAQKKVISAELRRFEKGKLVSAEIGPISE
ncbi:MAG: methyltransferase domain-containing protein [Thermoplasmata archaeon]|nr:methyltransferase domain-containing protein [Thermoplasmata archaeon]